MPDDAQLLQEYVATGAEGAFRELVKRHVDFVYATALRRVNGDAHLAEDVSQEVFVDLARKAGSLVRHPFLPGWLHRSTRYAAVNAAQARVRQMRREKEALNMETTNDGRDELAWDEVRPELDAVLDRLGERERNAVLLRFVEGRTFAEVAGRVAASEDGARMLVARSLEKMRRGFERRGIHSTTAALSAVLASAPAVAAPAGMAATVGTAALTAGGAGGAAAVGFGFLLMSKTKIAIIGAVLAAVVATTLVQISANGRLRAELANLNATASGSATLARENGQLTARLAAGAVADPALAEMNRLRQRAATLAARPPGVIDSELKPASTWRNAGRESLAAANETFHWALYTRKLDEVAKFVTFQDDTPENRAAFLAQVSAPIRDRYQTPERIWAAGMFRVEDTARTFNPGDAFQVMGNGDRRSGGVRLRVWYRDGATGDEKEGGDSWQQTPAGWTLAPLPAFAADGFKLMQMALANLDPVTGDFRKAGSK